MEKEKSEEQQDILYLGIGATTCKRWEAARGWGWGQAGRRWQMPRPRSSTRAHRGDDAAEAKGHAPPHAAARRLQNLASDGPTSRTRAYRGSNPQCFPCTDASVVHDDSTAVVMAALVVSGAVITCRIVLGRGSKQKVGSIDSVTQIGRRKRLESKYSRSHGLK